MDYMNLTTEDFITVAYQTGGKTVNHSINGVGTIIWRYKVTCFSCSKIQSRWTKVLNILFYMCLYVQYTKCNL